MQRVAIVGAGELGGAIASRLAARGHCREIRLIDQSTGIASGKALDIQQAGPIDRSDTKLTAHPDVEAAVGSPVVVLADQAASGSPELGGESGLAIVRRIAHLDPDAVILCAGATARTLVEHGVGEAGIRRTRLAGTAPEALASAVRAMVALETDSSPAGVSLSVLGLPPDRTVVAWSESAVAGYSVSGVLGAHALTQITRRLPALWPPGPYALASAAVRAIEAVLFGSRRFMSCFVVLDGELGARRVASAFPVMLGPRGIERIAVPSLSPQERVLFENAVSTR